MKKHLLIRLTALILALCGLFTAVSAQAAIPQPQLTIRLTWEPLPGSDGPDIQAWVNGILDDGGEVLRAQTEGEYYSSSDYSPVGSHYVYGNGNTELLFYRLDGIYDIIVEWYSEEAVFSGMSYADVNLNIEISTPDGILMNIAANPEAAAAQGRENLVPVDDYYCRGGTGVWYFGLKMDHGSILPPTGTDPGPLEETPVIQEIQSNYIEAYNDFGFKTVSEWYDNGVITAYTYWDYDESGRLLQVRFANLMDPDEVKILFTYENGAVQMYNAAGTLLSEAASAYDAAEMLGVGYIIAESMNGTN